MQYSPWLLLSGVVLLFYVGRFAYADVVLNFGIYAADKPYDVVRQLRPLLNELETMMTARINEQVVIKMNVAPDYESGIRQVVMGEVDFARLGPASYVIAKRQEPRLSIVALENDGGDKQFFGVICVKQSSRIRTISDLRGASFAFGDENSTIGRYLVQQLLLENGIYAKDFARFVYLGRHDLVGASIAMGRFDAGAIKESTFKALVAKGDDLRAISRISNVTHPWVTRAGLPSTLTRHIRESLLSIQAGSPGLTTFGKDGFLFGTDADFESIRNAVEANHRFFSQ